MFLEVFVMEQTIETASASYLLSVAAVAIALLLLLIMKFKVHAFASLILVSLLTALATGIELPKIVPSMLSGFGGTLASVAILVGLGAMIGKILEYSGGAQTLADTLIGVLGKERAPLALGIASLLFGFPIFFDAGLVVMLPVILSVAKRLGGSVLLYAIPAVGAFSVMHAFLPPHPGPVAAGGILGANIGYLVIIGLVIGLPTWFLGGYLYGVWTGKKWNVAVPELFASGQDAKSEDIPAPKFSTVLFILLAPMLLIFVNTGVSTLIAAGAITKSSVTDFLMLIGQTPIALLITLLLAVVIFCKPFSGKKLNDLCEHALGPVCSVILVTGAGGMFGGILRSSGIGDALASTLNDLGIPVILAAFIIAACLRIAQGSATVALTTAAALIAPIVSTMDLTALDLCAIVAAISGGSIVCSHFNDSGFWLVKGLFGIDEKLTLRTWTVMETLLGTIGFLFSCVLYMIF